MEEISLKGEKYIKATILAEKLGYTSDYVGQLCRGKQVKATLVGRSWYVNEESLRKHKKTRYRSNLAKAKESFKEVSINRVPNSENTFMKRLASYSNDEGDLLPSLKKKENVEIKQKIEKDKVVIFNKNIENKPLNSDFSGSSEIVKKNVINNRITKPSIRIIATSKKEDEKENYKKTREVIVVNKKNGYIETKNNSVTKNNPLFIFFVILLFLIFVTITSSVLLGLEKKVVVTSKDSSLVLYDFDIKQFVSYVKNKINSY